MSEAIGPCGKVLYASKSVAAQTARKLRAQRGHLGLEPRKCSDGCDGWHLGGGGGMRHAGRRR